MSRSPELPTSGETSLQQQSHPLSRSNSKFRAGQRVTSECPCNELPCHSHEQPKPRVGDSSPAQTHVCPLPRAPSVLLFEIRSVAPRDGVFFSLPVSAPYPLRYRVGILSRDLK